MILINNNYIFIKLQIQTIGTNQKPNTMNVRRDGPQVRRRIGGGVQKHNRSILHGVPRALILRRISFDLQKSPRFQLFHNAAAISLVLGRIASALVVRVRVSARLSLWTLGLTHCVWLQRKLNFLLVLCNLKVYTLKRRRRRQSPGVGEGSAGTLNSVNCMKKWVSEEWT